MTTTNNPHTTQAGVNALQVKIIVLQDEVNKQLILHPEGIVDYTFAFFYTAVEIRTSSQIQYVPPYSFVVWQPGTFQCFGDIENNWRYSWMTCSGFSLRRIMKELKPPYGIPITFDSPEVIENYFNMCYKATSVEQQYSQDYLFHLMWTMMLDVVYHHNANSTTGIPKPYIESKQYIDIHFAEPIKIGELAERSFHSENYFSTSFKNYFGVSPIEYLTSRRLSTATLLLSDRNLSITEIADRIGYTNVNSFEKAFKRHYNCSPREMRYTSVRQRISQQILAEETEHRLKKLSNEGWRLVLDQDFSRDDSLNEHFQCLVIPQFPHQATESIYSSEFVSIKNGRLHLLPATCWAMLQWQGDLAEEMRIELVVADVGSKGPNIALSINGNLLHGYRIRLLKWDTVQFETVMRNYWEILHRSNYTHDEHSAEYQIALWRSGSDYYAEINGKQVMKYRDPLPPSGEGHRNFSFGSFWGEDDLVIRSIRVLVREPPGLTDCLEPGRVMLRLGLYKHAWQWLNEQKNINHNKEVQNEIAYLLAMASETLEDGLKEKLLIEVANDTMSPFSIQALRDLLLSLQQEQRYQEAFEYALRIHEVVAKDPSITRFAMAITASLTNASEQEQEVMYNMLRKLPATALYLSDLYGAPLHLLEDMALEQLECSGTGANELSFLRNMPLIRLVCQSNEIVDLSPLTNLPLQYLNINYNLVSDLSALSRLPLREMECVHNEISSVAPLADTPLTRLIIDKNQLTSLAPLHNNIIEELSASSNLLTELPVFSRATLTKLNCAYNQLHDLTSLQNLSLRELNIEGNAIISLAPLYGMPLTKLNCVGNPITDLTPLAGQQITSLKLTDIPQLGVNGQILADMPLKDIEMDITNDIGIAIMLAKKDVLTINGHHRSLFEQYSEIYLAVFQEWQRIRFEKEPTMPSKSLLRDISTKIGERSYLIIPQLMSHAEAQQFCQWQGGYLAGPPNAEQLAGFTCYLQSYNSELSRIPSYHLGIKFHAELGVCAYDGTPITQLYWSNKYDEEIFPRVEYAMIDFRSALEMQWLLLWNPQQTEYFIIEWH